ncbi:MAG: 1-acyl-sn-glycerol-3-phosphate acyltransferase [Pseudomonadales bacterium]|nr:1-acyl-sn-glycerol-3-phosphate acyltransferase [Pseudomonadales bacterium]
MSTPKTTPTLFIKSILFYILFAIVTVLYTLPCVVLAPFLSLKNKHAVIAVWGKMFLWLIERICGVKYEVSGLDKVSNKPAVVMSKHQSDWETFAFLTLFNPQSTVAKKELLTIPFFGWCLKIKDPVIIDRSKKTNALKQLISQGKENLKKGCWVMIFPEGTRVAPGEPSEYSSGGAFLAQKAGVSIIPIAHNAGEFCPPRGYIKYPGTIQVVVGPEISTEGKKAKAIMKEVESWIRSTMAEISPENEGLENKAPASSEERA